MSVLKTIQQGFTLMEIIVGIVTLSVVLLLVSAVVGPQFQQSANPMLEVRANELAQSVLNEIIGKAFDENSPVGGALRCSETGAPSCTAATSLGAETGESRPDYDDVDDYINITLQDALGKDLSLSGLYTGFSLGISVFYDDDLNGIQDVGDGNLFKLIRLTVTSPNQQDFVFTVYKGNY